MKIRKGADKLERSQKRRDSDIERTKAVQDYNIMMGILEDPAEEEEDEDAQ